MIYCPVREEKVLYIKCLDCDEKELCEELTEKERLRKKMRIECPKFKNADGVEIYVVVGFHDYTISSKTPWLIEDVKYRLPRKKTWISFMNEISDDYRYRAMSVHERDIKRHNDVLAFVGEEKVREAFEYAWQYIKPDVDKMLEI